MMTHKPTQANRRHVYCLAIATICVAMCTPLLLDIATHLTCVVEAQLAMIADATLNHLGVLCR